MAAFIAGTKRKTGSFLSSRTMDSDRRSVPEAELPVPTREIQRHEEDLPFHPCLHPVAHHKVARLHLPVAPRCNTQCGYCEREISGRTASVSAPGLSAVLLTPRSALIKTRDFLARWGQGAVVGVAGPGEPLANPETIDTLGLIRQEFPDQTLCLCTNGVNLPENLEALIALKVQHLTVTVNGVDPSLVGRIQSSVIKDGCLYRGERAGEILIHNQLSGLVSAVEAGMTVKVNCVVVPEINGDHVATVAEAVHARGARIFNPIPLIPRGFFRRMRRPDDRYMARLRSECSRIIPVFSHCKQCRADAEGIPGKEQAR